MVPDVALLVLLLVVQDLVAFLAMVGTWAGVLLAAVAGVVAYFLFRVESRRDVDAQRMREDQGRDLQRQQASKVSAWVTGCKETSSLGDSVRLEWRVELYNGSDQPVFNVGMAIYAGSGPRVRPRWKAGGDPEREVRRTTLKFKGYHQVPVVPPVKSMEVTFSSITQKKAPKRADIHQFKLVILEFDDASNLPWRRGIDGALIALRAREVISPERHLEWTY